MNLSSGCAGAVQSAAYCLSIVNQISVDAPCSSAASACAMTTLSLLFWVLSLQTSQRINTIPQHRTAPNNPTPTHSLKYETAEEIHEDNPSMKDRSRRVELIWTMATLNYRSNSLQLVPSMSSCSSLSREYVSPSFCSITVLVSRSGTQKGFSSFCGKTQTAPLDLIRIGSGPFHSLVSTSFHFTNSLGLCGSEQCLVAAFWPLSSRFLKNS